MNRVIPIGDDIDSAIVITRHGSTFRIERCLDSARHDKTGSHDGQLPLCTSIAASIILPLNSS